MKRIDRIKNIPQEIFDGFMDELEDMFQETSYDYFKGKLIAQFILSMKEYT